MSTDEVGYANSKTVVACDLNKHFYHKAVV